MARSTSSRTRTLHQRIVAEMERKIVSGRWPVGHRLPFEVDLARDYGCSRMTVNKVLTQLARAGLVERVRRRGTFVRPPAAQSAVLEIHDIRSEVSQLGLSYAFAVTRRERRKATAADRRRLDVPPATPVLDITCVHLAGGRPFCVESRLVNLAVVPGAARADFAETPPGPWLLSQVPWSSAEHRIHAIGADAATAAELDVSEGTACLVIERRTWSGAADRPVTQVRLTYPGDRHALVARFAPAS